MAIGADFYVDVTLMRGTGVKSVAARAVYAYFIVIRVDGCLHVSISSVPVFRFYRRYLGFINLTGWHHLG
jgi:hypothetical protein